jgi:hypothetical protein
LSLHAQVGDLVSKAGTDVVANLATNTVAGSAAETRGVAGADLSSSISGGGGSATATTGMLSDLNPILYPVLIVVFTCTSRRYHIKSCN